MSCPDCFSGHVHSGNPQGKVTKIHGRDTYVAEPDNGKPPKGVIIIIPDAFGWDFVNNRILADHYASAADFLVYLPDFMDGTAAPTWLLDIIPKAMGPGSYLMKAMYFAYGIYGFAPFIIRNRFSVSWSKVRSFFEAVRANEAKSLPIGSAGFCWGGQHTFHLAKDTAESKTADGKPLIDGAFTAHPSNLAIPKDIEEVRRPVAIAIGDIDFNLSIDKVDQIKKIFEGLPDVETEVVVYPGAGHGFSIRADYSMEDGQAKRQATEAEEQAIVWFKRSFTKAGYKQ